MPLQIKKIKARRLALGLSQEEAAHRADTTLGTWNQIETGARGNIHIDMLCRIAASLGLSAAEILGDESCS